MVDPFDLLLAFDDATPAEQAALRDAVQADPALARDLVALRRADAEAAQAWQALAPDRSLLVLLALDEGRHLLDDLERARLDAARPALARLIDAVPATLDVLARIAAEAASFEQCWNEPAQENAAPRPLRWADDRAAQPRARSVRRTAWRVSLVFTLALIAAVGTMLYQRDASKTTVVASAAQLLHLPDGSQVRLRPGATLQYAAAPKTPSRTVTLTGDAVFDVQTTGTPFTVNTPSGRIVVTGTVFGVRAHEAATEVTLVEGRVLLAPAGQDAGVTLAPGQQSRVVPGALPTTPAAVDLSESMAWSGQFYFRDTPLRRAAEQLGQHFGTSVTVADRLAAERVNGEFDEGMELSAILNALAATLPEARVDRVGEGFRIR